MNCSSFTDRNYLKNTNKLINKHNGGLLWVQIFRKVCFQEQKYDFWPIRTRFDPFKGTPKFIFFAVFLCHIEPTCQKLRFYNQTCKFWPLGPLFPFSKGPPNSSKTEIFKNYNFFCFTLSLLTKNYVSITKIVNFGPLGPFCPF